MASSMTERENIVRKNDGLYTAQSQRSDGSWRKERKVKEGYIPPDEMPVYKTRQRAGRESSPVSRLPPGLSEESIAPAHAQAKTKAQKKNEKRKEKKKLDALSGGNKPEEGPPSVDLLPEVTRSMQQVKLSGKEDRVAVATEQDDRVDVATEQDDRVDVATEQDDRETLKKVRQIRKKLKQVDDLQARIDSGSLPNPDPDQLAKLGRRQELADELLALGVDYPASHCS